MQIDISVLVTIIIFVLSLIGALIMMLYRVQQDHLKQLQLSIDACEAKLAAESAARVAQYDGSLSKVYSRIEDVEMEAHRTAISTQQQLGDLNTTVAGFGGTYVPRSELNQLRDEIHSRGRKI